MSSDRPFTLSLGRWLTASSSEPAMAPAATVATTRNIISVVPVASFASSAMAGTLAAFAVWVDEALMKFLRAWAGGIG